MTNSKFDIASLEKLRDSYLRGSVDRRTFLKAVGVTAAGLGIVTGSGMGSPAAAATTIRFDGWGGAHENAMRDAAFKPFSAATGNDVVMGNFGEENEILTKVRVSEPGTYNLVFSAGTTMYKRYVDIGFGSVLNEANIPNLSLIMPAALEPFRKITPDGLSAVPFDYSTTGIAYNKNHISLEEIEERGFDILMDKKYEGRIGASYMMQDRVWWGALQAGQDPNAISDIDAVWDKLRESRSMVKKYWTSGAEFVELMTKEEIIVSDAWSPRTGSLIAQGAPVGFYNPPKAQGWIEDIFVLKGSPMEECEKLINFILDPAVGIAVYEAGYKAFPVHDPNKVDFPAEILDAAGFDKTGTLEKVVVADAEIWTPNMDAWQATWDRIARGG